MLQMTAFRTIEVFYSTGRSSGVDKVLIKVALSRYESACCSVSTLEETACIYMVAPRIDSDDHWGPQLLEDHIFRGMKSIATLRSMQFDSFTSATCMHVMLNSTYNAIKCHGVSFTRPSFCQMWISCQISQNQKRITATYLSLQESNCSRYSAMRVLKMPTELLASWQCEGDRF